MIKIKFLKKLCTIVLTVAIIALCKDSIVLIYNTVIDKTDCISTDFDKTKVPFPDSIYEQVDFSTCFKLPMIDYPDCFYKIKYWFDLYF